MKIRPTTLFSRVTEPTEPYFPASMVFNGSNQTLNRTNSSTATIRNKGILSFWIKHPSLPAEGSPFAVIDHSDGDYFYINVSTADGGMDTLAENWEEVQGVSLGHWTQYHSNTNWHHYFFKFDLANATGSDRVRCWHNGSVASQSLWTIPGITQTLQIFTTNYEWFIGSFTFWNWAVNCKLAFVEVSNGDADYLVTDFGVNNSGVWTRKKFQGDYGTHGFHLDGSTGVLGQDVSGNGLDFTPVNMTAGNLDDDDLPPYINT